LSNRKLAWKSHLAHLIAAVTTPVQDQAPAAIDDNSTPKADVSEDAKGPVPPADQDHGLRLQPILAPCQREATLADHLEYVRYYKSRSLEPGIAPGTVKVVIGEDDPETYAALMANSVPNHLRWYVVTVGIRPGVYQGW
jgi:hypothetical protein